MGSEFTRKYFPVKKGFIKRTVGSVKATDDVTFDIYKGETFGLVGESGCGKTTVGKLILQLHKADSGEILFEGTDLTKLSKSELQKYRKDIQIIFQDPYGSLNAKMKVGTILAEGIKKHKLLPPDQIQPRVLELLKLVGLHESDVNKYPHEFSGGQRQRIGIARALILNPEFVVCDEAVSALDVSVRAQVLNLMRNMQQKKNLTYLFISHDLSVVRHISDRIAVMYLGQLIEKAPSELLFDKPTHPYTQALLSAIPVPSLKKKRERIILKGEITSPINPKPGCRFAARCPYATDRCRSEEPVLREIEPNHFVPSDGRQIRRHLYAPAGIWRGYTVLNDCLLCNRNCRQSDVICCAGL